MRSKSQLKKRNREIIELLRDTEPDGSFCFTLQSIASAYGLTRERVRQIGMMANLPPRRGYVRPRQGSMHGVTFDDLKAAVAKD
jgi:hypothetical protein